MTESDPQSQFPAPPAPPAGMRRVPFDEFVGGSTNPMYIVTTADATEHAGCLVGFATQASMSPPRILVCLSQANHTYRIAMGARTMAVHLLDQRQRPLAALFGHVTDDHGDKFDRCDWQPGPDGVPLLSECPKILLARVGRRFPFGDHTGFLIEPVDVYSGDSAASTSEDADVDQVDPLMLRDVADIVAGHPA